MKFEPGHEKVGGRKKGTINRRSKYLYEVLDQHGFSPVQKLIELLPKLEPKDQAGVLLRLLAYLYPQRKPVEYEKTGERVETPAEYLCIGGMAVADLDSSADLASPDSSEDQNENS